MAAGLVASLYLGWGSQLFAAPVITNMPHRADGTRITGSQPVPKEMPRDVAVKTKPATPKPATPPTQAAPKAETPKPATPKPATPPTQAAPKAETPKPATPKPATPPTQAALLTVSNAASLSKFSKSAPLNPTVLLAIFFNVTLLLNVLFFA